MMTESRGRVAALLPVRKESVRCANKMLRPFGDTNLARLALEKIAQSREVDTIYYAANGDELLSIARDFPNVRVIERSRTSALGEDAPSIYDFMDQIEEPLIASMNACCPFLRIETFDRSVKTFREGGYRSLLAAISAKEWYWGEDGRPLIALDSSIINSKMMPKVYRSAHAFLHFKKAEFLRDHYRIWTLQPHDPFLFDVSAEEAIDINDEFEFEVAEALYTARIRRKGSLNR